jgi:two-component system KDP operon response regulator KdpE
MTLRACKILAIDDAAAILTFLRISLESQGAAFYSAGTATDGLRLCAEIKPDIVILDLGLPDRSGMDILPDICKHRTTPDSRTAPIVIVLTVRKEQSIRQQALERGASDYLTKPFLVDDLLEVILAHLHEPA